MQLPHGCDACHVGFTTTIISVWHRLWQKQKSNLPKATPTTMVKPTTPGVHAAGVHLPCFRWFKIRNCHLNTCLSQRFVIRQNSCAKICLELLQMMPRHSLGAQVRRPGVAFHWLSMLLKMCEKTKIVAWLSETNIFKLRWLLWLLLAGLAWWIPGVMKSRRSAANVWASIHIVAE